MSRSGALEGSRKLANVGNSDVAGVHNENDFNMLTSVAERTIPCHFPNEVAWQAPV
jgi:hypothetical protein